MSCCLELDYSEGRDTAAGLASLEVTGTVVRAPLGHSSGQEVELSSLL